ncbi:uncharacterized protein LOC100208668 isoform X2 [Hydra vulgaris]|uniref:uncharacterized protein LOC100208668 isoform X2 n=1 Tax=Hydra vulgaris TaxID=6087 RepID=UPI001F5F2D36|nr:uncharacterized protein LOC100208668 isoform X2 [Hydra vulgaris]
MAARNGGFDPVVDIDAGKFTEAEKKILLKVVARDEEIRIQEKSKIETLKTDLKNLREKGVPDGEEEVYGRVCKRCRTPLGFIFNSGALCPNCSGKVCKSCRVMIEPPTTENTWLCTICAKIRDIRAESGAWFYDSSSKKTKTKKVYGSFLIKSIFSKAKRRDTIIYRDPDWTEIIEKDEPIPDEEDDRDIGYLMITPNEMNSYSIQTGKMEVLSDKSVVYGDGSLIVNNQSQGANLPLNLFIPSDGSLKADNPQFTDKILVKAVSLGDQNLYSNIVSERASYEGDKSPSISSNEDINNDDISPEKFLSSSMFLNKKFTIKTDDDILVHLDNKNSAEKCFLNVNNEAEICQIINDQNSYNNKEIEKQCILNLSNIIIESPEQNLCVYTDLEINKHQNNLMMKIDKYSKNDDHTEDEKQSYNNKFTGDEEHNLGDDCIENKTICEDDKYSGDEENTDDDKNLCVYTDLEINKHQNNLMMKIDKYSKNDGHTEDEKQSYNNKFTGDEEHNLGDDCIENKTICEDDKYSGDEENTEDDKNLCVYTDLEINKHQNNLMMKIDKYSKNDDHTEDEKQSYNNKFTGDEEHNLGDDCIENKTKCEDDKYSGDEEHTENDKNIGIKQHCEDNIEEEEYWVDNQQIGDSHEKHDQNDDDKYNGDLNHIEDANIIKGKGCCEDNDHIKNNCYREEDSFEVINSKAITTFRSLSEDELLHFHNNMSRDLIEKNFATVEDEVVIKKDSFKRKENCYQLSDDKSFRIKNTDIKMDFSKMANIGSSEKAPYVAHNDSDLKELQNMFLKKKKIKKLKTDEHSDASESESENDECINVVIPQVFAPQRSLSEDELMQFHNDVLEDLIEKNSIIVEDELVINKDSFVKKEVSYQFSKDNNLKDQNMNIKFDFSTMKRIESSDKPSIEQFNVTHNDLDLIELQKALSKENQIKKLKTNEHSDTSESEDCMITPQVVNDVAHNKIVTTGSNEKVSGKMQLKSKANSVESIESDYSNDDDVQPAVSIAGEIKIGFKYNAKDKVFEVQVHQAKDLIVVDEKKNSTDPYVKVYLQPDVKRGGKRKTKPKKNTLNPEFDEILKFEKLDYNDLLTRTCLISVWHYDFYTKNILLGEVSINLQEYINSGYSLEDPLPQWYSLCARVVTKVQVKFIGKIVVNLRFESSPKANNDQYKLVDLTKGSLLVKVKRAHDVLAVTEQGYSNPFCKVTLICPGFTFPKFKTSVAMDTVNPIWENEFVFSEVSLSSLKNSTLQLSVWDYEKGSEHLLLGAVRLGLGKLEGLKYDSFGEEVTVWQHMLDNPSSMEEYTIPLRSSLDSVKEDESAVSVNKKGNSEKDLTKKPSVLSKFLQPDSISLASSGSMLSIYSSQGGEQRNLIITGEILFSLKYDSLSGIFSVNIEKAKEIAAANSKLHSSDPYVKVYLLPDKSKSTKKKTTHKRKTLNPQWNETIKYKLSKDELLEKVLQVSIWNHDRFGRNDFLGEVQVNIQQYSKTNSLDTEKSIWYTLQEMTLVSVSSTNESKGQLRVALKYDNNVLTFVVKDAVGLPQVNPDKLINPFVRCYLLPDRTRKSKRKTTVQKKTQNPVWNEKLEFNQVSVEDLQSCVLEVTVWDHDSSSHQFLAGMRLGLSHGDEYWHDCIDKEVLIWESMMRHRGIFAEFTIPLRGTMTSRKGEIPIANQLSSNLKPIETESNKQLTDEFESMTGYEKQLGPGVAVIKVALQYVTPESLQLEEEKKGLKKKSTKGVLKVHLKDGKNLPVKKDGDLPSTFCKVFMYPKKKNLKFKTKSFMKSVDPIWDTGMSFENVMHDELADRCLEIAIFDESVDKNINKIGIIRLGSGQFKEKWDDSTGREIDIWTSMLSNPNKWVSLALPLRLQPSEEKNDHINESLVQDTKKKKKSKSSQKEELIEIDEKRDQNKHIENKGNESPRTAALRAMGVFANNIVDVMQKEDDKYPQENLTSIAEENELDLSLSPRKVPEITVTTYIKPGDPPFPGAGHLEEHKSKEPKKQAPSMSLMKRSASETSLTSVYSTDSANIYGQIPIRGEIQFGMKYDDKDAKFEVHIFKAISLAAVDTKKETSDPYCKVYLLPDKTKKGKKKTKTKKKTLDPDWEEVLTFPISQRDLRGRTLWVSVWHQERLGRNIFLGEVMLNMDSLVDKQELNTTIPKLYALCEKGEAPTANLTVGELKIALMFEDQGLLNEKEKKRHDEQEELFGSKKKKKGKKKSSGKINVHIKEACHLPAADSDGFSDPFCKCYLLPLKSSKTKKKTPIIRRTVNPVWDFQLSYELDYEDLSDFGIEFTIWDWDRAKNDFLGCTRINLGGKMGNWDDAEGVEILAWQHLIDQPNKWKDFVIPLRSSKDVRKLDLFK